MNKLFNLSLPKSEMETLGKSLGADVVPCFYNRAVLAEGIGDLITTINTKFKYYIVIIKPIISCNTKDMYKRIDSQKNILNSFNSDKIIKGLEQNNIKLISQNLYNTFESVQIEQTLINNLKSKFISKGAIGSLMTGSGSCVYGIFKDKLTAKSAYDFFNNNYETYICTSYNSKKEW